MIGGGATGLGIAVDAASRGLRTALIEARDFSSGTSSRSTKLIHGGVRYLAQGNVKLVREALIERARLIANAPALVRPLEFIVPCYRPLEREFMRIGLGLYDALAGTRGIGPTRWLSRAETMSRLPTVRTEGLAGGVSYWDAQFDDARLAIALMRTAVPAGRHGDQLCPRRLTACECRPHRGRAGGRCRDRRAFRVCARKVVYNATGVWVDRIRAMADASVRPMVALSRGSHIVVDARFLPGERALMIPKTADGRVLFAIPWLRHLIVGTTDVPTDDAAWEPQPTPQEIDFIVETARGYLRDPIGSEDITQTFAGLRPLVAKGTTGATKTLSREHSIVIEQGNLVTITGGKWTTYRRMAHRRARTGDAARTARAARVCDGDAAHRRRCRARSGAHAAAESAGARDAAALLRYRDLARACEQARTSDDLLTRRLRIGLIDRRAAEDCSRAPGISTNNGDEKKAAASSGLRELRLAWV